MFIPALHSLLASSDNIVFLGGAGVSTESGIPDFRSTDGLYSQKFDYPPESILSHSFFFSNTLEFYRFYRDKLMPLDALPNPAHFALAKLEAQGKLSAVITQNVDGLHQKAGSKRVLELHGSIYRNYCLDCSAAFDASSILQSAAVPHCRCGGIIKPDVVLFEESLNPDTLSSAIHALNNADLLIVGGTSLTVYPAASLLHYYKADKLVLINRDPTPFDNLASLVINQNIAEVLSDNI